MEVKEAVKLIKKKALNAPIAECREWSGKYYFTLYLGDRNDIVNNCYTVDKKTGTIGSFSPGSIGYENLNYFMNRPVIYSEMYKKEM